MKKSIVALLLALLVMLSSVGCGTAVDFQEPSAVAEGETGSPATHIVEDHAGNQVEVPYEIRTPVIVQYYSSTPKGVFFFYKNSSGEYESHPMNKVFDGIYTAAVLLFADETTTGYI